MIWGVIERRCNAMRVGGASWVARMNGTDGALGANGGQCLGHLRPGQLELAASHAGELVERLDTDGAALGEAVQGNGLA